MKKSAQQVIDISRKQDKLLLLAFTSPNGEEALKLLIREFDQVNDGTDAISMARYEGRRDVVRFIQDAIKRVVSKEEPDGIS